MNILPVAQEIQQRIQEKKAGFTREYTGMMYGGGLVIYGEYGLLAGYLGYSKESETFIDAANNKELTENAYRWSVFPITNAGKLPWINRFVNLIGGFFNMDNLKMNPDDFSPAYKANVLFKRISLTDNKDGWHLTASTYLKSSLYNLCRKAGFWI